MQTASLGFWPFTAPTLAARVGQWLRVSPATARRLMRQAQVLDQLAAWQQSTGRQLPPLAGMVSLTQARSTSEVAINRYQFVMAKVSEAYARALTARKLDAGAMQLRQLRPDGGMNGLGAVPAFLIIAIVLGVLASVASVLWAHILNKDEVIVATGIVDQNAKAIDAYLVQAQAYTKANPTQPPPLPPIVTPPAGTTSTASIVGNVGGLLTIGAALWVFSMLPRRAAS